ncbi:RHS repeat-associated core domain-containing protein [Pseudomonas sp. Ant30-3]|uniref:RHS repeat-associated core domain-containing protein n=1 Tax=Pseudomonas sp. Ant30-3 TaxID=1488328 RepID=UPI00048AE8AA|nr:RHS repeat-associated core domain-containing protein [Pseudomonas sp. Ant30-3]
MINANTPAIAAIDPRGLSVRGVAYHRRDRAVAVPDSHVTQQINDVVGRAVLSRDPRLFLLHRKGNTAASQINVHSLGGALLLSDNNDAGWRLGLLSVDGTGVEGWDRKLSHSRTLHDSLRRPVAVFENAHCEPERCIARFAYADANTDDNQNRRGRLIRQDDTAGTLHFFQFGLAGIPLEHSRTFINDPQWPVDWPKDETERDGFLEDQPALTRIHCNAAGEPIKQIDAQGNVQISSHTCAAQLKAVGLRLADSTETTPLLSEIQYNALGLVERQRAGNGVISSAIFSSENGRLEQLTAGLPGQPALQDLSYVYDPAGNITSLTDAANPVHFHRNQRIETINRYAYDSLYRLIEARGRQLRNAPGGPQLPEFQSVPDPGQMENYSRIYTYDEAGNLLSMHHQAGETNRTERTAIAQISNRSLPQRLDGELPDEAEIAAGHDANGNRIWLQPGQRLQWDLRNQLRQVSQVIRQDEPDDTELYCYDGSGQRLRKIRQTYTGTLTRTHETRYLPGLEIRSSADEVLHVITIKAGRGTVQILHWEKKPDSDIAQDQQRYSFTDHLNSCTLELDAAGRLISRESFYPYGGTCWWAGRSRLEADYKTLRYSGQERDATGLYYYGFRYYAPWCQRWLSADPAGVADGLNLYAFVHANPVGHVDIAGLQDEHSSTDTQRRNAAGSAFLRDFTARTIAGIVEVSTVTALNTLTPSQSNNNVLAGIAGVLDAVSVGIVGTGVAAHLHPHASVFGGLVGGGVGVSAALWSSGAEVEGEEPALNQIVVQRIGAAAGAITREIFLQIMRRAGENYSWGEVGLRQRMPAINRTALAFVTTNVINGALGQFIPATLRISVDALIAGADGFAGAWWRSRRSGAAYVPAGEVFQSPPVSDTAFGAAGRIATSEYVLGVSLAVDAATTALTGLPVAARSMSANIISGAVAGALTGLAAYRAPIMQGTQNGLALISPDIVENTRSDVQSTQPRLSNGNIARRNSLNG